MHTRPGSSREPRGKKVDEQTSGLKHTHTLTRTRMTTSNLCSEKKIREGKDEGTASQVPHRIIVQVSVPHYVFLHFRAEKVKNKSQSTVAVNPVFLFLFWILFFGRKAACRRADFRTLPFYQQSPDEPTSKWRGKGISRALQVVNYWPPEDAEKDGEIEANAGPGGRRSQTRTAGFMFKKLEIESGFSIELHHGKR